MSTSNSEIKKDTSVWLYIILNKKLLNDDNILQLLNGKSKNKKIINKIEIDENELNVILYECKKPETDTLFYNLSKLLYLFKKEKTNPRKLTLEKISNEVIKTIIMTEPIDINLIFNELDQILRITKKNKINNPKLSRVLFLISYLWYNNFTEDDKTVFECLYNIRQTIFSEKIPPRSHIEAMFSTPNYENAINDFIIYFDLHQRVVDNLEFENKNVNNRKNDLETIIEKLNTKMELMESKLKNLTNENSDLDKQINILKNSILDKEETIESLSTMNTHMINQIRGSIKGMLSGRIIYLMNNAKEALNDEIPQYEIVKQRLDETINQIKREIICLESSE